ncbi:TMV resistance protein N-like [Pistacia vera]|uniref:TMV resistance protein N-like n=1 Tax=Pistacia vera TaxID=55513 RepID=UPI001262D40A|nr:TMV resistance protein N-like [Pistacia vera]
MEILDACGFYPNIGISVLIEKSLIAISDDKFWMHDLLQVMGWEIVREKLPHKPGKWSRLWLCKDIYRVLEEKTGTHAVECIILDQPKEGITYLNGKSFSNMGNLRLLQITSFQLSENLEYLSNELRILDWHGYPSNTFPPSFHPENLFELNICYSHIEYLWDGTKSFGKLKAIDLSHSCKLIRTPDFMKVPNLERLNLEGCTRLLEVHPSVGVLKRLIVLNLKHCKNLVSFPSDVYGLKSLKILNLYGCSKLDKLPQNLGEVKCLEELDASGTSIRQVPSSLVCLRSLETLALRGCIDSMCLIMPHLTVFSSLKVLDLGDCNILEGAIPNDIGSLSLLEELNLSRSNIVSLPESMKQLLKLRIC